MKQRQERHKMELVVAKERGKSVFTASQQRGARSNQAVLMLIPVSSSGPGQHLPPFFVVFESLSIRYLSIIAMKRKRH